MQPTHSPAPVPGPPVAHGAVLLLGAVAFGIAPSLAQGQEPEPPPPERPGVRVTGPEVPTLPPLRHPAPPVSPQETGYVGMMIRDLSEEEARDLGLSQPRGARIAQVLEESPAGESGLQEDDVVVGWEGEAVRSALQLRRLVRETPPGRRVRVAYLREGEREETVLTVAQPPGRELRGRGLPDEQRQEMRERMEAVREQAREAREHARQVREQARQMREHAPAVRNEAQLLRGSPRLGLRLLALTEQLAGYFGLEDRTGILVASVELESPAREAGLRAGDVILSIHGSEVDSPGEAARVIRSSEGEQVEFGILRRGERRTLTVQVPGREGPAAALEDLGSMMRRLELLLPRALERQGLVI